MSCNGCRVLRKGCSDACILRPCLQWIESPEAQGYATVFVAKFFGRAGLMSFISGVPETQRPALFQSLLFEACGRTINPVKGAVGLLWSGDWHLCQEAVETVLRGGTIKPPPDLAAATADDDDPGAVAMDVGGKGGLLYVRPRATGRSFSAVKRRKATPANDDLCDLDLCLSPRSPAAVREEKRRRPTTPSMTSEGSVTTSGESGGDRQRRLLNLFI